MSSEPPPNPIIDTFNPSFWERIPITDENINVYLTGVARLRNTQTFTGVNSFTQNPLNTATQPADTDSSTIIPSTAWVQGAIKDTTKTFTGVNTFSQSPLTTATQPASNDSSTIIPSTAWVQGAITANGNNLTYLGTTYPLANVPPTTGFYTGSWGNFTLPSVGTWLITANFLVEYIAGASTTFSQGYTTTIFEIGVGPLPNPITIQYKDYGEINSNFQSPTYSFSIIKNYSVSKVITITQPTTFGATYGLIDTTYGTQFSGSVIAVKISSI
jgi:hypothetical protein